MPFTTTPIPDLLVFEPKVHHDNRGYFFESYTEKIYKDAGLELNFIQDNQARSTFGVLRGLHYQLEPYAQTKLIRVVEGKILDVAVDLRTGSPTYGQYYSIELTAENKLQLLVPKGFAHGYVVLSPTAEVMYKVDNIYHKASEGGVIYNDPSLNIDWQIDLKDAIVSEKDAVLPTLANCTHNFVFQAAPAL